MAGIAYVVLLPILVAGGAGVSATANASPALTPITAYSTGFSGMAVGGATEQQYLRISATASSSPEKTLQAIGISAIGVTGSVSSSFYPPNLELQSWVARSIILGFVGSKAQYPLLGATAVGITGEVGLGGASLPVSLTEAFAHGPLTGSLSAVAPLWFVSASASLPSATTFSTISMHTEVRAPTAYTNYPFTSYTIFNGQPLGVTSAGIFQLSGDLDGLTSIAGVFEGGDSDMETPYMKNVSRVYVGGRATGDLKVSLTTDGPQTRGYLLPNTGQAGVYENRATLGKGVVSRYFRCRVENIAGSKFYIQSITLRPTLLKRPIGGGGV